MEKKRFHIIIATMLFAILLWVSVNMSYDYQTVVSVPLVIENLAPGQAIATPLPRSVQLKLRGTGWRNAALMLGAEPRCIIDIGSLPMNKRRLALYDIVDRITMPLGIQPVDMKPESLFISYDRAAQKRVPVMMNADVGFRAGYGQVNPTLITPDSVTIGGAVSLLALINAWPTAHSTFGDLKSSVDADVPLADSASHYLTLSPPTVHVHIDVQQYAEKTIAGLPVEARSVPQNKEVILIPPKIDVVVRGGVDQLATLSNDSFHTSVDYNVIVADSTGYTDATIVAPKGVQLVARKPERLQFIIRSRLQ